MLVAICRLQDLPGPPKEPKILAHYLKMETISSIGSIIFAILEVQVGVPTSQVLSTLGRVRMISSRLIPFHAPVVFRAPTFS